TAALQNMFVRTLGMEVNPPVFGSQSVAEVPPFAGGPSQEITSPVRITTMLMATIGQLNGVLHAPMTAGPLVLATVTFTGAAVVKLAAASRATAVTVWEALVARVVSQVVVNGGLLSSDPKRAPSR